MVSGHLAWWYVPVSSSIWRIAGNIWSVGTQSVDVSSHPNTVCRCPVLTDSWAPDFRMCLHKLLQLWIQILHNQMHCCGGSNALALFIIQTLKPLSPTLLLFHANQIINMFNTCNKCLWACWNVFTSAEDIRCVVDPSEWPRSHLHSQCWKDADHLQHGAGFIGQRVKRSRDSMQNVTVVPELMACLLKQKNTIPLCIPRLQQTADNI